jgi:DNA primase
MTTTSRRQGLLELLVDIGLEDIDPRDDEIHARCPDHERRTGAREQRPRHWSINRLTGAMYCFSCGYSGGLTKLVMDMTGKGLWDVQRLILSYGVDPVGLVTAEREEEAPRPVLDLSERLEQFVDPPARAMRRRQLQAAAVTRYGVRWDEHDSAWVLPIRGPLGDLWGYQTKSPTRVLNHPPGVQKSTTLFGLDLLVEEKLYWHLAPAPSDDYVVLVESPLDVIRLDGLGYPAVSSFGALVSDDQLRLILRYFTSMILALDNDETGRRETDRILAAGWHRRVSTEILSYAHTKAKDVGDMTDDEVETAIEQAHLAVYRP